MKKPQHENTSIYGHALLHRAAIAKLISIIEIIWANQTNKLQQMYPTTMRIDAHRDRRPANTGGALCSTPQFGWRPLLECRAVTLPRRETRWNYLGCPKLTKRSQPLVGRSPPYCGVMWRRYCCFISFFPIVDTCLSCEDIARKNCAMVRIWWFFASFLCPVFPASRAQHISDLHSKFALGPHRVWKYGRHPICGRWD